MRALVTGATGFVGPHLLKLLDRPVVLSRDAERARESLSQFNITAFSWDAAQEPAPAEAFDGIDAVIHLAGEPVADGRWTEERKRRIRESREIGTRNLVETLRRLERKPSVLVSASAVGWYGSRGDEILEESAPPADDFLAEVCIAWEREARAAAEFGMRVVCVRVGIVLGKEGGALAKMLTPFKLGVGGPLGNGRQWMPWIHVDDLAAMFLHAAKSSAASGPMNGTAPNPVTNKDFTRTLAKALHRPAFLPTPYFALRLAIGEFASVLYQSQRAIPKAALDTGFTFRFPQIEAAWSDLLGEPKQEPTVAAT